MSDAFANLIPDARRFLRDLSKKNTRDWFIDHKAQYEETMKAPALLLVEAMRPVLADLAGQPVTAKLFRPQRDIRFSKDKTPYKTHMHMLWDEGPNAPAWFFGISPDYVTVGCGRMKLDKDTLIRWREAVDSSYGAELATILDKMDARMDDPALKRVPAPYDKDHPRGALLRRKSCVVWQDGIEDTLRGDVIGGLKRQFEKLSAVPDWLRSTI